MSDPAIPDPVIPEAMIESLLDRHLEGPPLSSEDHARLVEALRQDPALRRDLLRRAEELAGLRAWARVPAVVPLLVPGPGTATGLGQGQRRHSSAVNRVWRPAVAAALLLAVVGGGVWWSLPTYGLRHAGQAVERGIPIATSAETGTSLDLGGYVHATLAPGSLAVIEGSPRAEQIRLDRGSITCAVDRHIGSFTVATVLGSVAVTGTAFSVQLDEGIPMSPALRSPVRLLVAVTAGAVLVSGPWGTTPVHAGEAAAFPPVAATAAKPSAESVEEMLVLTGNEATIPPTLDALTDSLCRQWLQSQPPGHPPIRPAERAELRELLGRSITWPVLAKQLVPIVQQDLDTAQVQAITAFHRTPVGQRLVAGSLTLTPSIQDVAQRELEQLVMQKMRGGNGAGAAAVVATGDPVRLAAAQRMLATCRIAEVITDASKDGLESAKATVKEQVPAEYYPKVAAAFDATIAAIPERVDQRIMPTLQHLYAKELTAEDMDAASTFYATPAGAALVATTGHIVRTLNTVIRTTLTAQTPALAKLQAKALAPDPKAEEQDAKAAAP